MGSAQEAFEEVLIYIHRASVFHQYSEMVVSKESKVHIDTIEQIIDQYTCNPLCASHKIFTFQICELTYYVLILSIL